MDQHFKIIGNELRVSHAVSLDFESQSQYEIKVRSVDATGDYLDKSFTIQLTNEKFDISFTSQKVPEQSAENTIVGRLVSNEPGNYQYKLLDDADSRFWLDNDLLRVARGELLDFETQSYHDITVQVIETTPNTVSIANNGEDTEENAIEKTFRIDIVNLLDMSLLGEVRDAFGNLIEPPIDATEEIQVSVQLIPDSEHRGLEADIIFLASYIQEGEMVSYYMLDSDGWYQWSDKYLLELPIIKRLTLQDSHNLQLFQGALTEFAGGEIRFYVSYRLVETGTYVYQQKSVDIMVNG